MDSLESLPEELAETRALVTLPMEFGYEKAEAVRGMDVAPRGKSRGLKNQGKLAPAEFRIKPIPPSATEVAVNISARQVLPLP